MCNHRDVVRGACIKVRRCESVCMVVLSCTPSDVRVFQVAHVAVRYSLHLVSMTTRVAVIIADVLVLLVTWSKTAQLYRESRRLGIKAPLATLMIRDGE